MRQLDKITSLMAPSDSVVGISLLLLCLSRFSVANLHLPPSDGSGERQDPLQTLISADKDIRASALLCTFLPDGQAY